MVVLAAAEVVASEEEADSAEVLAEVALAVAVPGAAGKPDLKIKAFTSRNLTNKKLPFKLREEESF